MRIERPALAGSESQVIGLTESCFVVVITPSLTLLGLAVQSLTAEEGVAILAPCGNPLVTQRKAGYGGMTIPSHAT